MDYNSEKHAADVVLCPVPTLTYIKRTKLEVSYWLLFLLCLSSVGDVKIVFLWHLESRDILISFSASCGTHKEWLSPPASPQQSFYISMLLPSVLLASSRDLDNSLLQYMVFSTMFCIASCSPQMPSSFLFSCSFSIATCVLICCPDLPFQIQQVTWLSCLSFSWSLCQLSHQLHKMFRNLMCLKSLLLCQI